MNNLNTVFWVLMTLSAIGIVAFVATLAVWSLEFFTANRPVRLERRESIPSYYGRVAFAN